MLYNKKNDLNSFIESVKGNDFLRVEEDLGGGYVKLKVTEAEKRQARHDIKSLEDALVEMLRNSRDAGARSIYIASHRTNDSHILSIIDDGVGVPVDLRDRIFEPRVTSKLNKIVEDKYGIHGRGMALFAIKSATRSFEIIDSCVESCGANFRLISDPATLLEKKDQSTFPEAKIAEGKVLSLTGIRNIPRILSEFILDNDVKVYFGSQTEILNALIMRPDIWRSPDKVDIDVEKHDDLLKVALQFGFNISGRNIYRSINGQIRKDLLVKNKITFKCLDDSLPTALFTDTSDQDNVVVDAKKFRKRRKFKGAALSARFTDDDIRFASGKIEELMTTLSAGHYVNVKEVKVSRIGNKLKFVIDLEDEQ